MTLETKAAFARRQSVNKGTVTRWAQSGRLVVDINGRVDVERSLALLGGTQGTRDDVADRHAQGREERAARAADVVPEAGEEVPPSQSPVEQARSILDMARHSKAVAEARRVTALADQEEMERDRMAGDLISREDVDASMKFIGATVRGLLDVFPDQTAPLVAPVADLSEVHSILVESCRNVLVGLGEAIEKQIKALAKEEA